MLIVWRRQAVYKSPIHELLVLAQETIRAGRSVWYVGSGGMALVGMIDASEQVWAPYTLPVHPSPDLERPRELMERCSDADEGRGRSVNMQGQRSEKSSPPLEAAAPASSSPFSSPRSLPP